MPEGGQGLPVGVLVVHGIGAQEPGETLAKLENGLRRVLAEMPATLRQGEPVTLCGRSVRFYEVYWADLLKDNQVAGTFDMNELSSIAWFPLFNQIRRGYAQEPYPFWTVLRWTIILPVVGFAVMMSYWGARLLAQLYEAVRNPQSPPHPAGATFFQRARETADTAAQRPNAVDKMLDEFAADVFNYINSAGDTFSDREAVKHLRPVYRKIIDRFYEQLMQARSDGCRCIQIVAHSLGTVVTYHALRGLRLDESRLDREAIAASVECIEHIYTIGSPLEKIRFFWPRLRCQENLIGERTVAWDNFVSYFDPVAGVLRRYAEWGEVKNHRLLGGGFVSGHVVYERSPIFLETFTRGLVGTPAALHRTVRQRLKDLAMLLGETLFAPVSLLVLVIAGLMLWVAAALLVPFLVSLPFRLFYDPETWGPILDYAGLFFGAMFLIVLLIVPLIHANDAFRRFRPPAKPSQPLNPWQ
jgi:hypothetical protein